MQVKRAYAAHVTIGEKLWVIGGCDAVTPPYVTPTVVYKSTEIFSDGKWVDGPDLPAERAYPCAASIDQRRVRVSLINHNMPK